MSANDRRMEILDFLLIKRRTSLSELQERFSISRSTAKRDIQELMRSYPIDPQQGGGGGIFLADGYRLGMKYFSDSQKELLDKLSETLTGDELATMQGILKTFSKPTK